MPGLKRVDLVALKRKVELYVKATGKALSSTW
ncbi:hypothetical protein [Caldivirga sp. UBA161]